MSGNLNSYSGQSNPPVNIMWMIMIGIIGFELPFAACEFPSTITYKCTSGAINSITGITPNHRLLTDDLSHICTINQDKSVACPDVLKVTSLVILYENNSNIADVIGGLGVKYYKLKCSDIYTANVEKTFTAKADNSSSEEKIIETPYEIEMKILQNGQDVNAPVKLGEELTLKLTAKVSGLHISPINCSALSDAHKTEVKIWSTDETKTGQSGFCKKEEGITTEKWKSGSDSIELIFYAFRFQTDGIITIKCSAYVCPDASQNNCSQVCVETPNNGGHRRRRSNTDEKSKTVIKQATASFQVTMPMGNEHNGSSGIFVHSYVSYLIIFSAAWMMNMAM